MPKTASTSALPKFRKYTSDNGEFYLSSGVVLEGGRPRVSVTRWNADYILKELAVQSKLQEGSLQLPNLYQSFRGDRTSSVAEWQSTLIVNPNAPTVTEEYVLMDADEKVLAKSETPRSLEPTKRHKEGNKEIVVANVYDIPFTLKSESKYNPEDLDAETGFLKGLNPRGKYVIWFGSEEKVYAAVLYWDGCVSCNWGPRGSRGVVGFRGVINSQSANVKLELPVELIGEGLMLHQKSPAVKRNPLVLETLGKSEARYRASIREAESGLAELEALRRELQDE